MSKNKKICIVVTIPMTIEWFVSPFARKLHENGYEVHFICDFADNSFQSKYSYAKFHFVSMSRGLDVKTFLSATKRMKSIFLKEKFDAVMYATPGAAYYASKACHQAKIKKRIFLNWGFRFVAETNPIKRFIIKRIEKATFDNSTFTLIVSKKNMEFAIEQKLVKREKIDVVGHGGVNGVDMAITDQINSDSERKKNFISDDTFVFGSVARFCRDKGVNELYSAFRIVRNNNPDRKLKLIFQGPVDELDEITENTHSMMIGDPNVLVLGRLPHIDTLRILSCFNCFVLPTYRDGFGTAIQEAMALNKPCITTDIPGPSEVIRNEIDGLLVQPRNINDLADKMNYLLNNPQICETFSKNAYEFAKEFYDSKKCVSDYTRYLVKLIEEEE